MIYEYTYYVYYNCMIHYIRYVYCCGYMDLKYLTNKNCVIWINCKPDYTDVAVWRTHRAIKSMRRPQQAYYYIQGRRAKLANCVGSEYLWIRVWRICESSCSEWIRPSSDAIHISYYIYIYSFDFFCFHTYICLQCISNIVMIDRR